MFFIISTNVAKLYTNAQEDSFGINQSFQEQYIQGDQCISLLYVLYLIATSNAFNHTTSS